MDDLEAAIFTCDLRMLQELLAAAPEAGKTRSNAGCTPLMSAAVCGWAAGVPPLLLAAPEVASMRNRDGQLPLHAAATASAARGAECVRLLLTAQPLAAAVVDHAGRTPLWYAAVASSAEAVLELLTAAPGAALLVDVEQGRTPLHAAVGPRPAGWRVMPVGDSTEAHLRAAWQQRAMTALQLLAVHRLLQAAPGAALQQDDSGRTPAHLAAGAARIHAGDCELLSLQLLTQAAPATALMADASGATPLQVLGSGGSTPPALFQQTCSQLEQAAAAAAPQPLAAPPADLTPLLAALASLPRLGTYSRTHRSKTTKKSKPETTYDAATAITTQTVRFKTYMTAITRTHSVPLPTFSVIAARQQLTAAEWQAVPGGDSCLASALPAVLLRSETEAGWLVARLPESDRLRLQAAAAALSVGRGEQRRLPRELVQRILPLALLDSPWR